MEIIPETIVEVLPLRLYVRIWQPSAAQPVEGAVCKRLQTLTDLVRIDNLRYVGGIEAP
jgi:hypothetical protein